MINANHETFHGVEFEVGQFESCSKLGHVFFKTYAHPKLDREKPFYNFVIVHGLAEYHQRQMKLFEYLNAKETQLMVTWIDLIGHGYSGGPRVYIEDFNHYVYDLAILLNQQMKDFQQAMNVIIGHSMGGLVALKLLLEAPQHIQQVKVSGLILSNPCIRIKQDIPSFYYDALNSIVPYLKKLRVPTLYTGEQLTHDKELAMNFDQDALIPKYTSVSLLSELIKATKDVRSLAYFLNIPTLFLLSGKDELVDAEITELFANGVSPDFVELKKYSELKHEVFNETQREIVFKDVKKWLNKLKQSH
jgi:lysophospholipase